jgi:O-acetylserine/cysteine efflux transporter
LTSSRAFALLDFAQLLSIALIWGVNNIAAKVALEELPAMLVVAVRFALVLILVGWRLRPLPREHVGRFLLMLACVGPLHFGVQYAGLRMADDLAPMVVAMQL